MYNDCNKLTIIFINTIYYVVPYMAIKTINTSI